MPTQSQQPRRQQRHQDSKLFNELSSLVFDLLRSPPTPISFSDEPPPLRSRRTELNQITPSGFASLLLGVSVALMLCGSVTFFIGFMLMPWVIGLIMVFYVVGIVTTISMLGRSLFSYALASTSSTTRKEIPAWKLL